MAANKGVGMSDNWLSMPATALGFGIGSGDIDPVVLTRVFLDAIDRHPMSDRIYARVTADRALAEATAAKSRAEAGQRLSVLDGVPVSWKDLFDTAGVATEAGSRVLKGRVPEKDAAVLARATSLGLVCLGKTHMSELAFSGLGHNPMTATSPGFHDHRTVAGGSSSGAAASVAFGLAAAAVGSDTGGSVRIPAGWNDLVGLKTTIGRLSVAGTVPLCPSFDTVGPLCRNVADCAAMLAMLGGTPVVDLTNSTLDGAKFLVLETVVQQDIDDSVAKSFSDALELLVSHGATIERAEVPVVAEAYDCGAVLFVAEAYAVWGQQVETRQDEMFTQIAQRILLGKSVAAHEYINGMACLSRAKDRYQIATRGYDAVVMPTSPILPPNVEKLQTDPAYYQQANLMALRNTRLANLLGLCALTIPTNVPGAGFMMVGPPNSEERLLRLGAAAERALA